MLASLILRSGKYSRPTCGKGEGEGEGKGEGEGENEGEGEGEGEGKGEVSFGPQLTTCVTTFLPPRDDLVTTTFCFDSSTTLGLAVPPRCVLWCGAVWCG